MANQQQSQVRRDIILLAVVLLAVSPEKLQELVNCIECAAADYNMVINAAKTKTMITHRGGTVPEIE